MKRRRSASAGLSNGCESFLPTEVLWWVGLILLRCCQPMPSNLPLGLSASIAASAALTGAVLHQATTIGITNALTMTTLQKIVITASVAVAVGTGVYEASQIA